MAVTTTTLLAERRAHAREQWQRRTAAELIISVGMGTCGSAAGAQETLAAVEAEVRHRGLAAAISQVGCVGMCSYEPMVEMQGQGPTAAQLRPGQRAACGRRSSPITTTASRCATAVIVGEVLPTLTQTDGHALHSLSFVQPDSHERIAFHNKQLRIVLSNCGLIDPESIDDYLALDGYVALEKVLAGMTPEEVIEEITQSGLRGRGGGGFPAGVKWGLARKTQRWPKVRHLQRRRGRPWRVHGPLDAGGRPALADRGHDHRRLRHRRAARLSSTAGPSTRWPSSTCASPCEQARALGLLGENILGSGFSFDIAIKEGAGAFVCGEETALMASIQGERGQPWPRPTLSGCRWPVGRSPATSTTSRPTPTLPASFALGADWFKNLGTAGSPGTAVFALTGQVQRTGLIEVPMGITLREIIYDVGGGMPYGKTFKAVQTGGPLGGCLPEVYLDTPVDFDSLRAVGAVMGSGGMIVADETTCMVEFAKYLHEVHLRRELWQVPPVSHRQHAHAGDFGAHHGGRRANQGTWTNSAIWRKGMQKGSLCASGSTGALSRPLDLAAFRGGVPDPHRGKTLPGRQVPGLSPAPGGSP